MYQVKHSYSMKTLDKLKLSWKPEKRFDNQYFKILLLLNMDRENMVIQDNGNNILLKTLIYFFFICIARVGKYFIEFNIQFLKLFNFHSFYRAPREVRVATTTITTDKDGVTRAMVMVRGIAATGTNSITSSSNNPNSSSNNNSSIGEL